MKAHGRFVLVLTIALGACDVEVRGGGAAAQDRVPPSGDFEVTEIRRVCRDDSSPLEPVRWLSLPETVNRIHARDGALWMVGESGLLRWDGARLTRLSTGRDFAFRADTLVRLHGESLDLMAYSGGAVGPRVRSLPARSHDSSLDVAGDRVYVHSTVDQSGVLLAARSLGDGRVTADLLEVERKFLHLFLNDFDRLLQDASLVRAGDGWVALVPVLRNPISLFDPQSRRRLDLHPPARSNGSVRSASRTVLENEQECPTCTRHVRERHETRYDRIHADAVIRDRTVWVLGSETPGANLASVYRFRLDSPDRIETYLLTELDSPPRALAISGDSLIVASEERMYWFELPRLSAGADCGR